MQQVILIIFIILFSLQTSAQTTEPTTNALPENNLITYDRGFSTEISYQGNYGFAFGGIIGKNTGHKFNPNYSCAAYANVVLADSLLFGPQLKLNWNYLTFFGVGLHFANHYRRGINDFRITPEVNFSLYGVANLFVGYSFNVSKSKFEELSTFRMGINLNIVGEKR